LQRGTPYAEYIQLAATTNAELHPKELEAINNFTRKLGITKEQIK
jgi:hypothetical protein